MQWQMKFAQMRSDANVSDEAGPVAEGCEMGLLVVCFWFFINFVKTCDDER